MVVEFACHLCIDNFICFFSWWTLFLSRFGFYNSVLCPIQVLKVLHQGVIETIVFLQVEEQLLRNVEACHWEEVPVSLIATVCEHLKGLFAINRVLVSDTQQLFKTKHPCSSKISCWVFSLETNVNPFCCFSSLELAVFLKVVPETHKLGFMDLCLFVELMITPFIKLLLLNLIINYTFRILHNFINLMVYLSRVEMCFEPGIVLQYKADLRRRFSSFNNCLNYVCDWVSFFIYDNSQSMWAFKQVS